MCNVGWRRLQECTQHLHAAAPGFSCWLSLQHGTCWLCTTVGATCTRISFRLGTPAPEFVSASHLACYHLPCCCPSFEIHCRRRPPGAFAGNELVTSKYNLLNFIPVNLYHQFKRVANMYFAALVCLQVRPVFRLFGGRSWVGCFSYKYAFSMLLCIALRCVTLGLGAAAVVFVLDLCLSVGPLGSTGGVGGGGGGDGQHVLCSTGLPAGRETSGVSAEVVRGRWYCRCWQRY